MADKGAFPLIWQEQICPKLIIFLIRRGDRAHAEPPTPFNRPTRQTHALIHIAREAMLYHATQKI